MTTDAAPEKSDIPTGLEITAMSEPYRENPHPLLDQLREKDPVHYQELFEGYVLTRHEDVERVLQDRSLFVDPRKAPAKSPDSRRSKIWSRVRVGHSDSTLSAASTSWPALSCRRMTTASRPTTTNPE